MALPELQRRHIAPSWLLEIDGITERYYSGFAPAASAIPATHVAVFANVQVSGGEQSLDIRKSIVKDGAASIRLTIDRTNGVAPNLLRLQSSLEATLDVTVLATTGATVVTVKESLAAWPAAGQIWIGQECMNYTAHSAGPPWTFTVPAGINRGYYGSQIQEHRVDASENWAPKVTNQCVAWRGRRARIRIAAGRRDDQTPDSFYVTEVSGFIDRTPRKVDALTIQLDIVPDTARLERELGGEEVETGLQHGWHCFDMMSSHLKTMPAIEWGEGVLWESELAAAIVLPALTLSVEKAEHLANVHDFITAPLEIRLVSDPARFPMSATLATPGGGGLVAPAGTVTVAAPGAPFARGDSESVVNTWFDDQDTVDMTGVAPALGPTLQEWPGPQLDIIHAVTAPMSVAGPAGRLVDIRILTEGGTPSLYFRTNTRAHKGNPFAVISFQMQQRAGYGIDFRDPATRAPNRLYRRYGRGSWNEMGGWPTRRILINQRGDDGADSLTLPIRGVADAYYDNEEEYLWVEDNVFRTPSPASPIYLRVRFFEGDEEFITTVKIEQAIQASTVLVGAPGWLMRLPVRSIGLHRPFGDWPGENRVTIRERVSWEHESPTIIILQLLLSGQGTGVNSATYDVLPFGVNLNEDQVDVSGIEAYQPPDVALRQSLVIEDATKVEDIIGPMLRLMSAALVHRLDQVTGARKLTIVPLSAPTATDSRRTIADGDWAVDDRPTTETDDNLTNLIVYKLNFDDGKSNLTVRVADRDSINRYEELAALEEELVGIRLPADDPEVHRIELLPPAVAMFAELAQPRRVIKAAIPATDALLLDVGGVVVLTASDVYDFSGSLGVTSVPGRIIEKKADWSKNEASLTIRLYDYTATGWAPALEVSAVGPGPNEVTVAPGGFVNAFTTADHLITGEPQTDLDYWAIGDVARAVPAGNYAASVAGLVVTAISATTITFGAPPGLAIGDTIRPDDYGPASTDHETNYAFLASDAGLLAAVDPAKSYA